MKNTILSLLLMITSTCAMENTVSKEKIIVGVGAEAVTLDPYASNDTATARATVNIFSRLLDIDTDGSYVSDLATTWSLISPTVVQVSLRTNVVFHNGDTFEAEDVKFSIERMLSSPAIQHIVNPINKVEIVDSHTVNIILKKPFAPIFSHFAHPSMAILSKEAVEGAKGDISQTPIGTGPYMLKTWNRGQNMILEVAPNYYGEAPDAKEVEFRIIPEDSARTIALETGDLDIAYDIGDVDRDRVLENSNLKLIERPIARVEYIGFNINKGKNPIWKDKRVREAIDYAIDKEGIINSVLFGAGTLAESIISESVVGHYDGLIPRKRDIEKAKTLLAEAGIPEGTTISMWTTEGYRQKIMEIVQANLREIGLDGKIEVYEYARFLDGTAKGEHDMFILGWTTVTGDADNGIYNLIHTDAFGGSGNRSFYSNPMVDKLLDQARAEPNPKARNALYKTIQETIYEERPFVPLYYKVFNVGVAKHIKEFKFDPAAAHKLNYVKFQGVNS